MVYRFITAIPFVIQKVAQAVPEHMQFADLKCPHIINIGTLEICKSRKLLRFPKPSSGSLMVYFLLGYLMIYANQATSCEVIAHRGRELGDTENSLLSMQHLYDHGIRIIEVDCRLTKDGVVILMHDETVDRVSGAKGHISEKTYAELKALFPEVTTINELLHFVKEKNMKVYIETKEDSPDILEKIHASILHHEVERQVVVISFLHNAIQEIHRKNPPYLLCLSCDSLPIDEVIHRASDAHFYGLVLNHEIVDQDRIKNAHARGLKVLVYTVNDPDRKAMLRKWGVDGLITDHSLVELAEQGDKG